MKFLGCRPSVFSQQLIHLARYYELTAKIKVNESIFLCRRKLTTKLQETEEGYNAAVQKASSTEKNRKRMESELEDALIDLEKVSCLNVHHYCPEYLCSQVITVHVCVRACVCEGEGERKKEEHNGSVINK